MPLKSHLFRFVLPALAVLVGLAAPVSVTNPTLVILAMLTGWLALYSP